MNTTPTEGAAIGAALRDAGMALAARNKEWLICRGTLALVEALLASPDGTATTDDATSDIAAKYPNGGKWRGSIPKRLAAEGIVESAGAVQSCRPARHRGYVTVWKLRDRQAAEARRESLQAWLVKNPDSNNTTNDTGATAATATPAN